MAQRKRRQSPQEDEPGLDVSSLIDVCFLLLIYFLVTTQIVKKEQELSMALPVPNPLGNPPEIAAMSIHLGANGNVSIQNESGLVELVESNNNSRELPSLSQRLALYKTAANVANQQALVQIRVDGDAAQQRVTDVLNALAGAHITEITFGDLIDPEAT